MYAGTCASREIPRTVQVLSPESLDGQGRMGTSFGRSRALNGTSLAPTELMRIHIVTPLALLILTVAVIPAAAQARRVARRAPAAGTVGLSASIGADIPSDAALDKGLDPAG